MADRMEDLGDGAVFVISIAAELSGMHPQTLRQYDRLGLVQPGRSSGGGRRYSLRDVILLREIARLSQDEGVNLAGIKRIIDLEQQVRELDELVARLRVAVADAEDRLARAVRPTTALVPLSQSVLAVWRPPNR